MLLGRREREDLTENTNRQKRRGEPIQGVRSEFRLLVVDEDHFSVAGEIEKAINVLVLCPIIFCNFSTLRSRAGLLPQRRYWESDPRQLPYRTAISRLSASPSFMYRLIASAADLVQLT